ncbi:alpha/beta-hydrolase [Pholiota conissans]|uniref:Alpha/beta-hydrolase n=1 Tax=Pholiota conissans TaxID=109636 RepID=A0A9P5Z5S4_9AGAR|nr:alpha/beta-hydrolase [Pholiota conissans]
MPDANNALLPRNRLTFFDRVKILLTLLPIPVYLTWAVIKKPFTSFGRAKPLSRLILYRAVYSLTTSLNRKQLRVVFGTTRKMYDDFTKSKGLPQVVEEIGEDSRLLWIGPKHTDRVIVYFHGGAYLFGALGSAPAFWFWMRKSLEEKGKPVGVAMLNYTLIPDRTFPTQLKQAVLAIQHVLDSGVKPENIQLAGDSAGGLLIHQVLSHMLHPVEGVPALNLDTPLAGAFMMSPWTRLRDPQRKYNYRTDNKGDFLTAKVVNYWGQTVMEGVPESATPYLEANEAPESWLDGLPKCTRRILITAGNVEVLRDEIIKYSRTVEKHLKDTTTIVQENGVHIDPIADFLVNDSSAPLTSDILGWLDASFSASASAS